MKYLTSEEVKNAKKNISVIKPYKTTKEIESEEIPSEEIKQEDKPSEEQ